MSRLRSTEVAERRNKLDVDEKSIKDGTWKPRDKEDKPVEKPLAKEVERVRREESGELTFLSCDRVSRWSH
jgi:hypothetical protein